MQNVMLEYDNGQMQERYVHYDAMRDAYAMHDMNAFTDRGPEKLSLLTCAFGGAVPHVCSLR